MKKPRSAGALAALYDSGHPLVRGSNNLVRQLI